MADETIEERQDNEFAALEAIYGDAVVDNRENIAWKIWRPLDLLLTLNPLHNSDVKGVHCSVTLHFKCCSSYPEQPPNITIHKAHGLSQENETILLCELNDLAVKLCGEVMIFQLAQHAQQFLHDHNKPTLSFYDEMLKQKTEMEEEKLRGQKEKENVERQKIKDEIQKRQEILRVAGRQRVRASSLCQESSNEDGAGDAPELVFYAENTLSRSKQPVRRASAEVACTCGGRPGPRGALVLRVTQKNNKKVYIGSCIGHSLNGSTTFLAIDDEKGQRLIAKKWVIPPATDFQTRNRQQTLFNQDLKAMCRLKHSSLVPYTAVETCKEPIKKTVQQCVYVFREFVMGTSLKYLRNKVFTYNDKFEALRLSRHIGLGVLSALKELHSVDVLHRDVRCENVFLDNTGAVKLAGVALDSRLSDMVEGESFCDRQTKALDVYAAGLLLYSIVCKEGYSQEILSDLPSSAKDFFSRCLAEDEHAQWGAAQLASHGFLLDAPSPAPPPRPGDSEDEETVNKIEHQTPQANGHSRLAAEFEVLTWLGKGAFGDVLKVKNKLDGGFYAIKRVKLNPENVQLNKKITREVKLLSRLNHENVVRYYNAWIESHTEVVERAPAEAKAPKRKDSLEGIVAKLGQEVKLEWSISGAPVQKTSSSDSEDDDDDADPWFNIMRPEDGSSTDIEFENDSNQSETLPSEDAEDAPRPPSERIHQLLYIQMEFCENNTLRQAIDNGLYKEQFRAWRLFREIVEGLAHVHQRGMIHRDLKPVNIFLDSNDHVKIGDFGLATKAFTALPVGENKQEDFAGSLTGQIGTALYVAPELLQTTTKIIYNQKVDIYSLGIILFEMFHPIATGMERMLVLTGLRTKEIRMPEEFVTEDNAKQIFVIRWLLSHDAGERPTCAELLSSQHVPRCVGQGAVSALLTHTLSDARRPPYRRLIAACLDQKTTPAEDFTYHNGMKTKPIELLATIIDNVTKIFRSHGGVDFSPPLLTPRAGPWEQFPNAVKVMTSSGSVCHLPHDLRLPFARHIAYTGIKNMRRYVVGRVYRERHVPGFHPREIVECAFDIVTPNTESLWADAEVLTAAVRAAAAGGAAGGGAARVRVRVNHTGLLRALLRGCGVTRDKLPDMLAVLQDVWAGRITGLQLQTHLTSLCVSEQNVRSLLRLMDAEVPVAHVRDLALQYAERGAVDRALRDLQAVCSGAAALGCECALTCAPFLAYNAAQHRGVFWQMSAAGAAGGAAGGPAGEGGRARAAVRAGGLIAAGGRYDALVEQFWKIARTEKDHDNEELNVTSVGFSMALERMATIVMKMEREVLPVQHIESTLIYVCICGMAGGERDELAASRRAALARELWAAGLNVCLWTQSQLDAHETRRAGLALWEDDAGLSFRLASWGDQGIREHKVPYADVLDFIKQKLRPESIRCSDGSYNTRSVSWTETEKPTPIISVTFITDNERITKNSKRQIENQIHTQLTSTLAALGVTSRVRAAVLAVALDAGAVRALAAQLSAPMPPRPPQCLFIKQQSIVEEVVNELGNLSRQAAQTRGDEPQLYALYSIPDALCRLIT